MASIINATTTNGVAVQGDNSGSLQLQTNNGTTAVTIDTSQNVGIGTTTPTSTSGGTTLAVKSSTHANMVGEVTTTTYSAIWEGRRTGRSTASRFAQVNLNVDSSDNGNIIFYTAPVSNDITERMRIDSSGRALFGSTDTNPAINNNPGVAINANSNNSFYAGVIQASATGNAALFLNRGADDGTTVAFRRSGTAVGNISVTTSSTAYNTSSDYRLKENITPMTDALAKVSQLKPCTYTWKSDGSAGQGFIAHELQEVVPDAVSGEKDAVDKDGNPEYQGVDTSFLVATLTAAIQELKAELDATKAEVQALKGVA